MYRRLIILSVIILGALCGLAFLGYHSVQMWAQGMEGSRRGEFAAVAEQIRQDVNRKFDEFVEAEQNRAYTDYQYYYVPDNALAQEQMPMLRSPLAGRLEHGLAYGQFQIEPDGTIVTPNDDLMAQDTDQDKDFYAEVDLNKKNVWYNVLPALSQVTTGSFGGATEYQVAANLKLDNEELQQRLQEITNERAQKKGGKTKASQKVEGRNYEIQSFQNPDLETQIISRNRAYIKQDYVSNIAGGAQAQGVSQSSALNVQGDSNAASQGGGTTRALADRAGQQGGGFGGGGATGQMGRRDAGTDSNQLARDTEIAKTNASAAEVMKQKVQGQRASEKESPISEAGLTAEKQSQKKADALQPAPIEPAPKQSTDEKYLAKRAVQLQAEASSVQQTTDVKAEEKQAEQAARSSTTRQANAAKDQELGTMQRRAAQQDRVQYAYATEAPATQNQEASSQERMLKQSQTQIALQPQAQMAEQAQTQMPGQAQMLEDLQDQSDMVQVRIEPFVPLLVPCREGEESVFGGQVFMLRHVQIEDKHFVQGFGLNEDKLIEEVEESTQRFMREGMGFELGQRAGGESAYTAILDFGFGQLVLNLIEVDPDWIARKISELSR